MLISTRRSLLAFAAGSRQLISRAPIDAGIVGLLDPEVIRLAADAGRIPVSHDRKTMPGHFSKFRETRSCPGIIIVCQSLDIGAAIEDLLLIRAATDAENRVNRLSFIPI
jgi:hypothetical protein